MHKYLKFKALSAKLGGRSRSSIFRDMRDRGFPAPLQLGSSVVWNESSVDAWLESRAAMGYQPAEVAPGAQPGRRRKS